MTDLATTHKTAKPLTGRHVLAITVSAFAVIIGVNLVMAFKAVSTFPGLEVQSSYVAGQGFNARRNAQAALGWAVVPRYAEGVLRLDIHTADGRPVEAEALSVLIGRTTTASEDSAPPLTWVRDHYQAAVTLQQGLWMMKLSARAKDGTEVETRVDFWVKE